MRGRIRSENGGKKEMDDKWLISKFSKKKGFYWP